MAFLTVKKYKVRTPSPYTEWQNVFCLQHRRGSDLFASRGVTIKTARIHSEETRSATKNDADVTVHH